MKEVSGGQYRERCRGEEKKNISKLPAVSTPVPIISAPPVLGGQGQRQISSETPQRVGSPSVSQTSQVSQRGIETPTTVFRGPYEVMESDIPQDPIMSSKQELQQALLSGVGRTQEQMGQPPFPIPLAKTIYGTPYDEHIPLSSEPPQRVGIDGSTPARMRQSPRFLPAQNPLQRETGIDASKIPRGPFGARLGYLAAASQLIGPAAQRRMQRQQQQLVRQYGLDVSAQDLARQRLGLQEQEGQRAQDLAEKQFAFQQSEAGLDREAAAETLRQRSLWEQQEAERKRQEQDFNRRLSLSRHFLDIEKAKQFGTDFLHVWISVVNMVELNSEY